MAKADSNITESSYSSTVRKSLLVDSYILYVDEPGTYTYIGEAVPGTATSDSLWKIKRVTDATGVVLFADGNNDFDNVWDNRASLSYS